MSWVSLILRATFLVGFEGPDNPISMKLTAPLACSFRSWLVLNMSTLSSGNDQHEHLKDNSPSYASRNPYFDSDPWGFESHKAPSDQPQPRGLFTVVRLATVKIPNAVGSIGQTYNLKPLGKPRMCCFSPENFTERPDCSSRTFPSHVKGPS